MTIHASSWYVKFPLDVCAMGPVKFDRLVDDQAVLQWARDFEGNPALSLEGSGDSPTQIQVWPVGGDASV